MYDYLITHAAYLNAIQACEDTRISLGVQKDILLENVSKLKAGNEGETITAFENTMKTLVEAASYASAVSKLEGMQTILEEELPKVNTLLRYVNNLDSQLESAYYRTPVAAGEEYVPPGEGKLALNEASAIAVVEKCRQIQEINEEIRMRFRSMLIALEGYLPESGQLQEALEKACNKVNRIENLEKAVTRYAADVKELSDDLKYRLAALTDNPEEVRFASGWNSTTQEEVVLLKLVEGPSVLKEHASELSNLEGISKESVIKEIEAYWNQEDGYFDENWWQDETKKRESLNILLLESLLTEDENGNVGGYDLMEHYTQTMPGSAKRYALQILFHLEPQDGDDEIVLNNIAGACSKRGIDLIGNGWVIPPEMMQFYVAYHELLEQEHDMEMKRALSIVLNFVPIVGDVKSILETIAGEDLLTGEELTGFEWILGIAAVFLEVLLFAKWAKNVSKGIKYIDDIPDAAYKGGKEIIEEGLEGTIKGGAPTSRPTWRQSELDAATYFPDYDAQKSFINGVEVPYGTKGSVRPDYYKNGFSVDIKNYNIESASGRSNLARNIEKQYYQRIENLPDGTKQSVMIDIRGQTVSDAALSALYNDIMRRTNNAIEILFKMD